MIVMASQSTGGQLRFEITIVAIDFGRLKQRAFMSDHDPLYSDLNKIDS
jgi:hypothetical protein